jgi:hypothetical protein
VVFGNAGLQGIQSDSALLVNKTFAAQPFTLPNNYETLSGQAGEIELTPFRSAVIVRTGGEKSAVIMPWLMLLLN